MPEVKNKVVTVESLSALHEYGKEAYLTKESCVDYIVEQNTVQSMQNDINWDWDCEKWNNGKVVCYCRIPYETSNITSNGDYIILPDESILRPQFPITFVEEPYVYASLQNVQGRNHWIVGVDVQMMNDTYEIVGIKLAANNIDDNNDAGDNTESNICSGMLNIEVRGKWK